MPESLTGKIVMAFQNEAGLCPCLSRWRKEFANAVWARNYRIGLVRSNRLNWLGGLGLPPNYAYRHG
jgi:hypothetical protein